MIIIFRKTGQLGNRLFNFANFIAFAAETGQTVINTSFDEYAQHFETTSSDIFCRYPAKKSSSLIPNNPEIRRKLYKLFNAYAIRWIRKLRLQRWLIPIVVVPKKQIYLLDDNPAARKPFLKKRLTMAAGLNFRDISGIEKHLDKIRDYFKLVGEHRQRVDSLISKARQDCDVLVGVHIRQGDYETHLGGRYFFDIDVFKSFMRNIEILIPNRRVGFLVCSNSQLDPQDFEGHAVTFGPKHFVEDMYSLAACDYIMGPPSTYTLWASLYGGARLYFIQTAEADLSMDDFLDYFSIVGSHNVHTDPDHSQYVEINGSRYNLAFTTEKQFVRI